MSLELWGDSIAFFLSEEENALMTSRLKLGRAAAVGALLWSSAALAAPMPVNVSPLDSPHQLVREQKGSKVESAKAWLKTKKNQSANWVNRQKTKLKRIAE
jgi:hypothetical protein